MGIKISLEQLRDYQERVKSWRKFIEARKGTEFNKEQNTTVKFIIPLLEILGWRSFSKDVEFEYHLKDKRHKTRHVDIALYLFDKNPKIPKILVEVKSIPRTSQDDMKHPAHQVFRDYLRANKVTYGILTNGIKLILFDKRFVRYDSKTARPLFAIKLKDFIEFSDVLWLLSKHMVENGKLDELVEMYHHEFYRPWFFPKRDMIKNKEFDKLAKIYKTDWEKKTGSKEQNEYMLRLVFAKKFLSGKNDESADLARA